MRNYFALMTFSIVAFLGISQTFAVEISGKVTEATGEIARITAQSGLVPNIGDKVKIFSSFPASRMKLLWGLAV